MESVQVEAADSTLRVTVQYVIKQTGAHVVGTFVQEGRVTWPCCDELRRQVVRNHPTLNGIDFLEVIDHAAPTEAERQRKLELHFVKPLGSLALTVSNITLEGGERITTFHVLSAVAGSGPPPMS